MKAIRSKSGGDAHLARLQRDVVEAEGLLSLAAEHLQEILDDQPFEAETPVEVSAAMNLALGAVEKAIRVLRKGRARAGR